MDSDDCILRIKTLFSAADKKLLTNVYADTTAAKSEAKKAYYDFCNEVVLGAEETFTKILKDGLKKQPLGIVCDFNGSARTVSIDKDYFETLGIKFEYINGEPGQIVHCIVPEGESLNPCCTLLEEIHSRDPSYVLGYVPDCDGDRGNLVIWDDRLGKARSLEAQEVFALAVVAELSHLVWAQDLVSDRLIYGNDNKPLCKAAVAINDPTSKRIDHIAEAFGAHIFRAEVGEANIVGLARKLRKDGYLVRILGEGSAGGNITHPSAVRDPIHTVLAIAKMLSLKNSDSEKSGFFKIWCNLSGQTGKYNNDFSLADIIASLPQFATTSAYQKNAIMNVNTLDHGLLKERYQQIFLREWEEKKEQLKARFGIFEWEAIAYNGMNETRDLKRFREACKGGLKILFKNDTGKEIAFIWMRGSATEPVFRIMADVDLFAVKDNDAERFLLDWQRKMIMEADTREQ